MYRSLGGIAPASPGYATVTIAPKISKMLDPVSVNASVATVRGVVSSRWMRHTAHNTGLHIPLYKTVPTAIMYQLAHHQLGNKNPALAPGVLSRDLLLVHVDPGRSARARPGGNAGQPRAGHADSCSDTTAVVLVVIPFGDAASVKQWRKSW